VLTHRALLHALRLPRLIVVEMIQPIMFVLLFSYVLGGAIPIPGGGNYREFLMAGIFAQTVAFGGASTGVGLVADLEKGLVDRFRSLPAARSAVLMGRTAADFVRTACVVVLMAVCGLIVGWRIHDGAYAAAAGFLVLLVFAFSMSWIGAYLGLASPNSEAASVMGIIWVFPLSFVSIAFVPPQGLPDWLRGVALWNPISSTVAACRGLFGNPTPEAAYDAFPMHHPVLMSLAWSALILAAFVPLAVRRYRAATSR
jgi:ABC transporter DrrB family efflux protein